ncbi:hypothetical protein PRIPAC_87692 [Pristionchus pacificus]|uniref:Uncharacterized protein n=1 Tax=Pristionchus pacificus TaxID=54126 RepID=A0A2A6CW26_PRIPA|nr:hypothetical protein PRIPAC_87692 [Pristionchus pacificus]|eukprot:PDM82286.1 hypothetical protein PRIPAC_36679 [Pristionchus pacificus]
MQMAFGGLLNSLMQEEGMNDFRPPRKHSLHHGRILMSNGVQRSDREIVKKISTASFGSYGRKISSGSGRELFT